MRDALRLFPVLSAGDDTGRGAGERDVKDKLT
jgi:hypothetical protein